MFNLSNVFGQYFKCSYIFRSYRLDNYAHLLYGIIDGFNLMKVIFLMAIRSFVWASLSQVNQRKRLFLIFNIVTVNKLTISVSNFQIIYTISAKRTLKTIVSMFPNKLRTLFKKRDAPPSKTCKFHSIDGEAHSNVSSFSDRTLAECYKSILPNFLNNTEPWIIYEWMGNNTRQRFEIRLWKILIG